MIKTKKVRMRIKAHRKMRKIKSRLKSGDSRRKNIHTN